MSCEREITGTWEWNLEISIFNSWNEQVHSSLYSLGILSLRGGNTHQIQRSHFRLDSTSYQLRSENLSKRESQIILSSD